MDRSQSPNRCLRLDGFGVRCIGMTHNARAGSPGRSLSPQYPQREPRVVEDQPYSEWEKYVVDLPGSAHDSIGNLHDAAIRLPDP